MARRSRPLLPLIALTVLGLASPPGCDGGRTASVETAPLATTSAPERETSTPRAGIGTHRIDPAAPGEVTLEPTAGGWRLTARSAPRPVVLDILSRELGFELEDAPPPGGIVNLDLTAAGPEALVAATLDDRPFRLLYAPDHGRGGTRLVRLEWTDGTARGIAAAPPPVAEKTRNEKARSDRNHASSEKPGWQPRAPRPPPPDRDAVERELALEVRAERVAARERVLLDGLDSPSAEARRMAARQLDPEDRHVSALLELLVVDDPDPSVRAMAARQLAFSEDEGAARALERALDDASSPVVTEALDSLERSRRLPDRARLEALVDHPDPSVSDRARQLLDDLE